MVFLGSEWAHKNDTHSHLACHRRRHGRNAVETRDERPHHEREASRCRNVSGDRELKRILNVKDAEHLKFAAARAERKRKREGCRVFAFLRSGFVALASQIFGFYRISFGAISKKSRQLSTISMARRVLRRTRSAVGFVER